MKPRGKGKIKTDYNTYDKYKYYLDSIKGKDTEYIKYKITQSEYSKIINEFNKKVSEYILKGGEYKLPARLGYIRIKRRNTKFILDENGLPDKRRLVVNWAATKALRLTNPTAGKVYHLDKFICRWYWNRYTSNVKNISAYSFIPSRTNARAITIMLDKHDQDYYE